MNTVLQIRQLIPPITARTAEGNVVRAWDYKQKRNLVIVFPHANCSACEAWLTELAARSADLSEREATGLLIYSEIPPRNADLLPTSILAATDVTGNSQQAFLGPDAFGSSGLTRVGVFVTDRYGELRAQWVGHDADGLPGAQEILSALWQIQIEC